VFSGWTRRFAGYLSRGGKGEAKSRERSAPGPQYPKRVAVKKKSVKKGGVDQKDTSAFWATKRRITLLTI